PRRAGEGDGRVTSRIEELPDVMAAVSVAVCAREQRPVSELPHVVIVEIAVLHLEARWMIFVARLAVQTRFRRRARIVGGDAVIIVTVALMARLQHVEVEPGLGVE